MPTRTGSIGSGGAWNRIGTANGPKSIGITMGANEYPKGTVDFTNIGPAPAAFWYDGEAAQNFALYLCDSNGGNAYKLFDVTLNSSYWNTTTHVAYNMNCPGLKGKALYIKSDKANTVLRNQTGVSVGTEYDVFSITVTSTTGGSCSCSHSSASPGTTITLTPTASTGYQFAGYTTSPAVTISNNRFTMPSSNITITATFAKITYSITRVANPSGGGSVTASPASATAGTQVTIGQTPNTGYYFNGWSISPSVTISNNKFTMPAGNVTVTANYLKRSTATLNKSSMDGGSTVTLTISADKTSYSHRYELSFGSGMSTGSVSVAAGVNSVTISVPLAWCAQIPTAASKTGGTLTLTTYNGSTQIGSYQITGLTFTVPASVKPSFTSCTAAIARTIEGVTYPDIGEYYVQNHGGVRIQADAAGDQGSTITAIAAAVAGYAGASYNKTVLTASIDFTTGLLTVAGTTTINVTATDSRGRTVTQALTIEVQAYSKPAGTLRAWRVDVNGDPSDMGDYGRYELTKQYTQLGTNTLSWTLSCSLGSANNPTDTGDIFPGDRKNFSQTQEYLITLTLTDSLEQTVITYTLPSARFIIFVDSSGNKLGFMKVPNGTIPAGKNRTIEFSADSQIYIGNDTLEDYIRDIVSSM